MAITKEELDQKLIKELRSHGGEDAEKLGREFLELDSDGKLAMVTVLGLRSVIRTIDKADMMILTMALNFLMKEESMMCGLLCTTLNEAIKRTLEERISNREEKGEENEQESN